MTTEDAKLYLTKRQIPRLFESLMTGLMYHRPIDHVQYLIDSLKRVQKNGQQEVGWNYFIDLRTSKSPLPPISAEGTRVSPAKISVKAEEKVKRLDEVQSPALPPIRKLSFPNVPVIVLLGNPGSNKFERMQAILNNFPGWICVSVGETLRKGATNKSTDMKWSSIKEIMADGKLVSDEIVKDLVSNSIKMIDKFCAGIVLEGYPRTPTQLEDLKSLIGSVDVVVLIDDSETAIPEKIEKRYSRLNRIDDNNRAASMKLKSFKQITLPVIREFDEEDRLIIIDGEEGEEAIIANLTGLFGKITAGENPLDSTIPMASVYKETGGSSGREGSPTMTVKFTPGIDGGRVAGLPDCPIILVAGGPGSERDAHLAKVVERYKGLDYISLANILRQEVELKASETRWMLVAGLMEKGELAPNDAVIEVLLSSIKATDNPRAIIIGGYPRDLDQTTQLNTMIGGITAAIVIDKEEETLAKILTEKYNRDPSKLTSISSRLTFFKNNTLPVIKYFDDHDKLAVIDAERQDDDEVLNCLFEAIDAVLEGKRPLPGARNSKSKDIEPDADKSTSDTAYKKVSEKTESAVKVASRGLHESEPAIDLDETSNVTVENERVVESENNANQHQSVTSPQDAAEDKDENRQGEPEDEVESQKEVAGEGDLEAETREPEDRIESEKVERDQDDGSNQKESSQEERQQSQIDNEEVIDEANKDNANEEELNEVEVKEDEATINEENVNKADDDQINSAVKSDNTSLKDTKVVFIVGGPGCGKGTQCAKIVEKFGYTHLSSGDLLRAEVESGSDRGKEMASIMEKGELVPMETVLQLLKEAMEAKAPSSKGFLIDGYPRELVQGTKFEEEITECQFVLYFDVSDDVMLSRLLERAKTSGRTDDNEDTIKTRLATFHDVTKEVVHYYEEKGKLKKISAEHDVDSIFAEVEKFFETPAVDKTLDRNQSALNSDVKVIFVVGGPGSGKGTQCARLVEKYGFCHLSSGDLLRDEVKSQTDRGKMIEAIMEKGDLVSLDVVLELLKDAIDSKRTETKCFLIDGYPREVEQGTRFENEVAPCSHVLYFDASDETMTARLLDRGQSSGRVDDNEETIKKRLNTFHNQTKPVVSHYSDANKVITIEAEGSADDIFTKVEKFFDSQSW